MMKHYTKNIAQLIILFLVEGKGVISGGLVTRLNERSYQMSHVWDLLLLTDIRNWKSVLTNTSD